MNYLIYIYYPLLILLILWGCKWFPKGHWNEEALSIKQTKALHGFCAVCIMLHHIGQKTCAPWLPSEVITHGLDAFVPIGYLLVGIFLFCSGFGLYKSYAEKPDYLQGFLGRRCLVPLLTLILTTFAMVCVHAKLGKQITFSGPFRLTGPVMLNGYSWFIYTLLIFYVLFYHAFKHCKTEKSAITWVLIGVLLYIFFCDWWAYGTWWYNSALLFVVGILFARHETGLIRHMCKYYKYYLPLCLITTCILFVLGEYTQNAFVQMPAACAFVILLILLGMKIKIGNKALTLLGSLTLELYLLHGIFLQLFGYNEAVYNPTQIKNVALLTLVVSLCTFLTAYPVHKLINALASFILNHGEVTAVIRKDLKKFLKWSFIILLVITVFTSINHYRTRANAKETIENYITENITFADVDGLKMSAYISGEGDHTIVLLRGYDDPCPTITLSPLADTLASQNKVIILDYFGCGFSDSTVKKRTAENFVYEIRTALQDLGVQGPYIFAAHELSGLYAQLYAEMYPEEVEAIIGLDSSVAAQPDEMLAKNNITPKTHRQLLKKQSIINSALREVLHISGYGRLAWPIYAGNNTFKISDEEYTILEEQFIEDYYSPNSLEERAMGYDNHQLLLEHQYPENLPALFILSHYACNGPLYPGSDWMQLHKDLCTNPAIQNTMLVTGSPYFVYYNPDHTAETIQKFIDSLDTKE